MRRHRRWLVYRLGPQYLASVGLPVLASKPGARLMRLDGGDGALMESLRRLRRDEAKLWRWHAPVGIWVVCLMEGCFCHLLGIYILVWVAYLLVRSSDFVCESDLLWLEKGWHGWIFDLIFLPRPVWEHSNSKKTAPLHQLHKNMEHVQLIAVLQLQKDDDLLWIVYFSLCDSAHMSIPFQPS